MDAELIVSLLLIIVVLSGLVVWLLTVVALALSHGFGLWRLHRRKMLRILGVSTLTTVIAVSILFLTGMLSLPQSEESNEKQLIAAARAKVKSEFRDPDKVQFQEVRLHRRNAFEKAVCGTVDSDEITTASRFIFRRMSVEVFQSPDEPQAGHDDDQLSLEYPPTIEGFKPTDAVYWERVASENSSFNNEWYFYCERRTPGTDGSEGQ